LPEEALTAPLAPGSNPACNFDILWAQCEQLVDYSNAMITDTLEQLETATNNIELATVITQLPIIDELGGDAIAGYIELLVDGIAENYAAEYDLSYKTTLACEIFCAGQVDCEITIERVYDILYARVVAHFGSPGEAINTIGNLLSYLLDQDIDGDVVVDTMMFLLWGGSKLINSFLQDVGTSALSTILNLAVNDANDDWILLCTECPEIVYGTPVIDIACSGGYDGGTNIVDDGDGFWIITATFTDPEWSIAIKDTLDRLFVLSDITYPDGIPSSCRVWFDETENCNIDCIDEPEPAPASYNYCWIWSVEQRVRFRMTIP